MSPCDRERKWAKGKKAIIELPSRFYTQLVYKQNVITGIILFGPFGQLRAVLKKKKKSMYF